jgi:hypothetical protein
MRRNSRFCKRLSFAIAAIACLLIQKEASAGVIFGNIAGNTFGSGYYVGPGGGLNNSLVEGFTMTQTMNLSSVDLMLSNYSSGGTGNLALSIYSSVANQPSANLYTLSSNVTATTSGTPTLTTFSGTGSFTLTSGTSYLLAGPLCDQPLRSERLPECRVGWRIYPGGCIYRPQRSGCDQHRANSQRRLWQSRNGYADDLEFGTYHGI